MQIFPYDELPWQRDELEALEPHARRAVEVACGVAAYHVIVKRIFVHQPREGRLYARAFLVDGVVGGIGQAVNGLVDACRVGGRRYAAVYLPQLLAVVGQVFELYPFLVVEEQNVQRLVHGSERHLLVIVRKDEAEVARYDETAQPCLGRFDEQLLQYGHGYSPQHQVVAARLLQARHDGVQFLCQLLGVLVIVSGHVHDAKILLYFMKKVLPGCFSSGTNVALNKI